MARPPALSRRQFLAGTASLLAGTALATTLPGAASQVAAHPSVASDLMVVDIGAVGAGGRPVITLTWATNWVEGMRFIEP